MRASSRAHGSSVSMRWSKRSRRVWRGCPSYSTSANVRCGGILTLTQCPSRVRIGADPAASPFFRGFLDLDRGSDGGCYRAPAAGAVFL